MSSSEPRRVAVGTTTSLTRLPPRNRVRRWLPFAVALTVVVGAITAADFHRARALFDWLDAHPGSDKVGHFVLLGSIALTLNLGLSGRIARFGRFSPQMGGLIIGALITLEEISQLWIPGRHFDLGDLAANYAGIAFADWLARRWLRSLRK